jgi:hypothetical protein
MKTAVPKNTNEIVVVIMQLSEEIEIVKRDIGSCQNAIDGHVTESRDANRAINDKINHLQYSVGALQADIKEAQTELTQLVKLSEKIAAVFSFIGKTARVIVGTIGVVSVLLGIFHYFQII